MKLRHKAFVIFNDGYEVPWVDLPSFRKVRDYSLKWLNHSQVHYVKIVTYRYHFSLTEGQRVKVVTGVRYLERG